MPHAVAAAGTKVVHDAGLGPIDETTSLLNSQATHAHTPQLPQKLSPSRSRVIFSLVLLVQFLGCFDGTIVASSHPIITSFFDASQSAPWLFTSFLLTSTAFQPTLGRVSDNVGRKPLFVGCLATFTFATAWCALAGSMESLILARALCGFGAGGLMTLGSIITSDIVPIE